MADNSISLSLPQMVDLALTGPEVGSVNFNILHSLLHVLVRQVNLLECNVEFRGNDCDRIRNLIAATFKDSKILSDRPIPSPLPATIPPPRPKPTPTPSPMKGPPEVEEKELQVIETDRDESDTLTVIAFDTVSAPSRSEFHQLLRDLQKLKKDVDELLELPKNTALIQTLKSGETITPVQDMYKILNLNKRIDALEESVSTFAELLEQITREQSALDERLRILEDQSPRDETMTTNTTVNTDYDDRFNELEAKFREYKDYMSTVDNSFNFQVNTLQEHLTDLEKEIGEIIEKINACCPGGGDTGGSEQGNEELYAKILAMQEEIERLTIAAKQLTEEKDNRQEHMDALLEQIEFLKTVKADREDLEDALANKADACVVNRKVSHDQFDAACDDLSRNIEDALLKLLEQEKLWQQALRDIQEEIENKLDKVELSPLKDFVQNKLKMLQDRLKALSALKKDTEAAGSKKKLLRDVSCISCDKDVVMRTEMDPSMMAQAPSLPPTKSMGPYLAYELDQLRQDQKGGNRGRNLRHFEDAVNAKQTDNDHLCNRYCGGSHTVTTPQQRVARVGHFLLQWDLEKQAAQQNEAEHEERTSSSTKTPVVVSGDIVAMRDKHTKRKTKM